jgi:GT2 family glycosyltransferase/SAM-dependent methyltransferase
MESIRPDNYNLIYHAQRWGDQSLPGDSSARLFEDLSERIILDLRPRSALDAGCGGGHLVKALRQRGVEAWGMDSSETAIQKVLPESQPFCRVGSILDPLPQSAYDLIICIDVIEHLTAEEAVRGIENLSLHCDDILFSSLPLDSSDTPHITTQPPEYWAVIFSRFGFIHDLEFDASFVSPWAMRFMKTQLLLEDRISLYERKIWQLSQEAALRRELSVEYKNELARKEMDLQYWKPTRLQAELDAVRNSTSWRLITHLQHFRERIIPLGSRRESAMRQAFRGVQVLRREGIIGSFVFSYQKLYGGLVRSTSKRWHKYRLRHSPLVKTEQGFEISSLVIRPPLEPHTANVDIIICVHNALEDTRQCLESLIEHTTQPYQLILVDDGSGEQTSKYLREFAAAHSSVLLRSEQPTGYPLSANRGMSSSSAEYLVLLNSDTILTPEWLDRLVACIQSDVRIGAVGPLSNTASWQSVPRIEENGDWASNPLPGGMSPAGMAQWIASKSARLYVDMPLLNGFCLLIRRKLLDEVGLFDVANFSQGYGEEDDLILRARKKGWKMALADDVYIYHAQSSSYSTDQRHALSERAQKILRRKHGERMLSQSVQFCRDDLVLEGIRARAGVLNGRQQSIRAGLERLGGKLLFVLPSGYSTSCSGTALRSECLALLQMGVKIALFHPIPQADEFSSFFPELAPYTIIGNQKELLSHLDSFDAIVGTDPAIVGWLNPISGIENPPTLGYYVQNFRPLMNGRVGDKNLSATEPLILTRNMLLFTDTAWSQQTIKRTTGHESAVIGPCVDIDLFRPRPQNRLQWPLAPLSLTAVLNVDTASDEPARSIELLKQACHKYRGEIEINLLIGSQDDTVFKDLIKEFPNKGYGKLSPGERANLLSRTDIYFELPSDQFNTQAVMEAMASGCAVIVPQPGGAISYAVNEHNSLIIDTSTPDNVWAALQRLIDDEKLRYYLRRSAVHDSCNYFPEHAALNMLNVLFRS